MILKNWPAADILAGAPELGTEGESSTVDAFAIRLYKESAGCIKSGKKRFFDARACDTILEIVRRFKDRAALTKTSPYKSILQYFKSINNILIPITISYSAAVQKLGAPEDHDEILEWLYAAIIQNTYDVFSPDKPVRDLKFNRLYLHLKETFYCSQQSFITSGTPYRPLRCISQ